MRQSRLFSEIAEEEGMKCKLCDRETSSGLCRYHEEAKRKVEAGYHLWAKAYGAMEWKDYLDKVKHNGQTGQWAKEIVEMLEGAQND